MAVMAARAVNLQQDEIAIIGFIDKDKLNIQVSWVGATVDAGIISGYPDKTFRQCRPRFCRQE